MAQKFPQLMRLLNSSVWFIEPVRGAAMAEALQHRLAAGSRVEPFLSEQVKAEREERAQVTRMPMPPKGKDQQVKSLVRIPMIGAIMPRLDIMDEMSGGGGVSLTTFKQEFIKAADDPTTGAILLEIDSPGGQVDLVAETAALIRSKRRAGLKIVAIANTTAASAAYWIAAAADELIVTPSGLVGSIGVFTIHEDHGQALAAQGVVPTFIFEGARKTEFSPFGPLDPTARDAMQARVRASYDQFTSEVAAFRGASVSVVRADPEKSAKSFGGGRAYAAPQLRALGLVGKGGMVDRIATLEETVFRMMGGGKATSKARARLELI